MGKGLNIDLAGMGVSTVEMKLDGAGVATYSKIPARITWEERHELGGFHREEKKTGGKL